MNRNTAVNVPTPSILAAINIRKQRPVNAGEGSVAK